MCVIFLHVLYILYLDYGFLYWKNGIYYGMLLGASAMLCILSLQTAIFWGQSSKCDTNGPSNMTQCSHIDAMVSLVVFSVFILFILIVQCGLLIKYKDVILSDSDVQAPLASLGLEVTGNGNGNGAASGGGYDKIHGQESSIQMQMQMEASRYI